ncbi:hypothetical protein BVX98_04150 [bacterium F11]|nr:hypothetical protein BVX98_04150 [bacterium F11]
MVSTIKEKSGEIKINNSGDDMSHYSLSNIKEINLLGLKVHSLTLKDALGVMDQIIQSRKSKHVCFVNAQTVYNSCRDGEYRGLINETDLVLADGMSIVWGARWLGGNLPERVAGPDVMENVCKLAHIKKYSIYLMGSYNENLEKLKARLLGKYPTLRIVGMHSPPLCDRIPDEETNVIVEKINKSKPHILFVGVSSPKQERWIASNIHKINVPLNLAVGAAFDFLSGKISRAPEFLRKSGMEWIYRFACEPRRLWKRYILGNAVFVALLVKEKMKSLKKNR